MPKMKELNTLANSFQPVAKYSMYSTVSFFKSYETIKFSLTALNPQRLKFYLQ